MKIETVYKGTCVLLGVCLITVIGYNVGVSKGEETDTSTDGIPDWWDLTKPKVEWIELEYKGYELRQKSHGWEIRYSLEVRNTLNYSILVLAGEAQLQESDYYQRCGSYHPIWFLNTSEGYQYRPSNIIAFYYGNPIHCLLPHSTTKLGLYFWASSPYALTQQTIYYEAYIESQHTIVRGVCEVPNITP